MASSFREVEQREQLERAMSDIAPSRPSRPVVNPHEATRPSTTTSTTSTTSRPSRPVVNPHEATRPSTTTSRTTTTNRDRDRDRPQRTTTTRPTTTSRTTTKPDPVKEMADELDSTTRVKDRVYSGGYWDIKTDAETGQEHAVRTMPDGSVSYGSASKYYKAKELDDRWDKTGEWEIDYDPTTGERRSGRYVPGGGRTVRMDGGLAAGATTATHGSRWADGRMTLEGSGTATHTGIDPGGQSMYEDPKEFAGGYSNFGGALEQALAAAVGNPAGQGAPSALGANGQANLGETIQQAIGQPQQQQPQLNDANVFSDVQQLQSQGINDEAIVQHIAQRYFADEPNGYELAIQFLMNGG